MSKCEIEISPWKSMVTAMVVEYGGELAMKWEIAMQLWVDLGFLFPGYFIQLACWGYSY